MSKEPKQKRTKVITPKFRVSFPHVFEAHAMDERSEAKYSIVMLFPKKTDLKEMEDLATDVMSQKFGPKAKWPKNYKWPFRDGAEKDMDGYADHIFVTASSKEQPGLIDVHKDDIIDKREFYAGCYARATVTCYAYDNTGNRGVAFGLQNIQKLAEGEPFSSRTKAQDDFDDIDVEELDRRDSDEQGAQGEEFADL